MLEDLPAISPVSFFSFEIEIPYWKQKLSSKQRFKKPFLLPSFEDFYGEKDFVEGSVFWNEEGLNFFWKVHQPFEETYFPSFSRGDSLEIFIDTRDQKTKSLTKFCHHFIFLPQEVDGVQSLEITKFRVEESRELADPSLFYINCEFESKSYLMEIHIFRDALYGFEPGEIDRLGFSYIWHRKANDSQYFSASLQEYVLARYPSLWTSCLLKK